MRMIENQGVLVVLLLVFLAVLALLRGTFLLWQAYRGPHARQIEKRLHALSAAYDRSGQARVLKQRMLDELPWLDRLVMSVPRARRLDHLMLQSGLGWSVAHFLLWCVALGAAGGLLLAAALPAAAALAAPAALCSAALPLAYVLARRRRRLARLERQLPDAIDLAVRALRAGHAFSSSLQMVGEEMPDPIGGEFRVVHDEINFGVSLQQALANLCERIPLTDLRFFVVAVMVQRESGGNLTEILGKLSSLIRERLKLIAKVRVLSSEGRLSAWVLGVLPFVLAGLMYVFNPEFMAPLWQDPIGIAIVKYMLALMAVGVYILKTIVRIRV